MVTVQFKSMGEGKCCWCQKMKSEVFEVAFGDGSFSGAMCLHDLRCAVRLKVADQREGSSKATGLPEAGKQLPTANRPLEK